MCRSRLPSTILVALPSWEPVGDVVQSSLRHVRLRNPTRSFDLFGRILFLFCSVVPRLTSPLPVYASIDTVWGLTLLRLLFLYWYLVLGWRDSSMLRKHSIRSSLRRLAQVRKPSSSMHNLFAMRA